MVWASTAIHLPQSIFNDINIHDQAKVSDFVSIVSSKFNSILAAVVAGKVVAHAFMHWDNVLQRIVIAV